MIVWKNSRFTSISLAEWFFSNCSEKTIHEFTREMDNVTEAFKDFPDIKYQDHYSLRIEEKSSLAISNDYTVMPKYDRTFIDIISFVIAKSVALERIEERVDTVFDEMAGIHSTTGQRKAGHPG